MKHLIAVSFVVLFWSDMLMASGSKSGTTENPVIKPERIYEVCMWLSPGDRLYYEFTSSANLRFNIHHHEGSEVQYPVQVKITSSEKAIFTPKSRKHYCLMWKNPVKKRVELNLHYQTRNSDDI